MSVSPYQTVRLSEYLRVCDQVDELRGLLAGFAAAASGEPPAESLLARARAIAEGE